jgi:hypothetical protein
VFDIQRQCETLANTLGNLASGARSRREKLQATLNQPRLRGRAGGFAAQLGRARRTEAQAHQLACDIRTLTRWLSRDILALAGPQLAKRHGLFDFVVENLISRLRNYFTLRCHLGAPYLDLPRFFLNPRRCMRSRRSDVKAGVRVS